jgi:DNA-binding NarL/FixJ family response regulator
MLTIEPRERPLTPREQQVCGLVALGYQNKEIANRLGISVRTVELHRASVYAKKGVRNAVELVRSLIGGNLT